MVPALLASASLTALLATTAACGAPARAPVPPPPEPPPPPLEFRERVATYMALRTRVTARLPPVETPDQEPAALAARQQALAATLRRARADAAPGDVFTAAVVPHFRRLVKQDLRERTPSDTQATLDQVPRVPFRVNDDYPDDVPRATIPPMLLARLPTLPDGLEYRLIGRHLLLVDTAADLIIDYIPGLLAPPP